MEINPVLVEKIWKYFPGYWEYCCEVTSDDVFENDEETRGGVLWMELQDVNEDDKAKNIIFSVIINGKRVWAGKKGDDPFSLIKPVEWNGKGTIQIQDTGIITFNYRFLKKGRDGNTTEKFKVDPARIWILEGNFVQKLEKYDVEGVVHLEKMDKSAELKRGPKDAKTGISSCINTTEQPDPNVENTSNRSHSGEQ